MAIFHIFIQFFHHNAAAAHQIYFDHTLSNSLFPTHPTVRWNIICLIYIVDKWNIITQIFFPQFVIIFARHAFTFINIIVIKIIMWQSCSLLLAGFKAMCTTPFHSQKFRTFFQRQPLFLMESFCVNLRSSLRSSLVMWKRGLKNKTRILYADRSGSDCRGTLIPFLNLWTCGSVIWWTFSLSLSIMTAIDIS